MRPKTPTLLIGALLLLGGGWWIGVAAIVTSHWAAAYAGHAGSPSVAAFPSGDATAGARPGDFAARIIARTNHYRVEHGCPALVSNPILTHTAQAHSEDMATHDFVGHNSSSGATIGQRIKAAGYTYTLVAENIAWGQQTPEEVVDLWFNESPPNDAHRRNILNCQLREIGVGYVYLASDPGKVAAHTYWTEDFGTRPSP